jgi:hypothetical protein
MTIEAPTSHYEDSEDDHHIGVEFVNVTDQEDHGVNQKTNVVTNVEQLITFLSFLFPLLLFGGRNGVSFLSGIHPFPGLVR